MPSALVVGATGLVGRALVETLLTDENYSKVTVLTRRNLPFGDKKYVEHVVDFDELDKVKAKIKADHIFCCLGTTIKKAGSPANFRKVDYDYPKKVAELALANGAKLYSIVTAINSNAKSSMLYPRTKGEIEETVKAMGYESVHIYQPSFLGGDRDEQRPGEEIGLAAIKALGFLMQGPLKTYRAIDGDVVAKVMKHNALNLSPGRHIFESGKIQDIYDAWPR